MRFKPLQSLSVKPLKLSQSCCEYEIQTFAKYHTLLNFQAFGFLVELVWIGCNRNSLYTIKSFLLIS